MAHLFDLLVRDQQLRPGVDRAEAAAWIATLAGDQVLLDVLERRDWSVDRYRRWLVDTVRRTLFPD